MIPSTSPHTLMTENIPASSVLSALVKSGIDHIVTVPDWMQLALHKALSSSPIRVVSTCTEDQAVCVSAGLRIGGKKPLLVIQNQGLYACMNSLRAVGLDAQIPTLFLIGQFGREPENLGQPSTVSKRNTVRYLEPALNAFNVRFWRLECRSDLNVIEEAVTYSEHDNAPAAVIVGAPFAWN